MNTTVTVVIWLTGLIKLGGNKTVLSTVTLTRVIHRYRPV